MSDSFATHYIKQLFFILLAFLFLLFDKDHDHDRGDRADDKAIETFYVRLKEFRTKTLPVIQHYKSLGLLIEVNGHQLREAVFNEMIDKLYTKAISASK